MTTADELAERLGALTIRDRRRLAARVERARRGAGAGRDELARLEQAIDEAQRRRAARAAAVPALGYPEELPVTARREELLAAIAGNQVVVVAGETGSGKTTQLPKLCLELGRGVDGMIGHTQPRRIAARTVAERLADELAVPLGSAVGYAVRFTDKVSATTLVKVMTDGLLLAEIRHDRQLSAYDTIIVDEAHERSLNIDFLLGYLTELVPLRPDLKVLITSATIDTGRFAEHFRAPVVEVSGRTYPVEIRYRPLAGAGGGEPATDGLADDDVEPDGERDINQAICSAVRELAATGPGDALVFLPGERDIRDAAEALRGDGPEDVEILPLYARLSAAEQHRVFQPHRTRRVVLATNVAETSLTVPGIRFVVDTGLARISRYNLRTKVQRLPIEPISRASADQRAGRCGRVAPGICIRLYAEDDYEARPAFTDPEILRTNLASVILQMAAVGLGEVERFPFVEPPDGRAVADGRALLEELGAFERAGGRSALTALGERLAELPVDPRLGRMVLEAERRDCLREVIVIVAALSIQDPRERPADRAQLADELHRRFAVPDSDFLSLVALWDYLSGLQRELSGNQFRKRLRAEYLNGLRVREWQDVASQIRQTLRAGGVHANSKPARPEQVHQALLSGLLSQIGMRDRVRGDYLGARNTRWLIGRASVLAKRQPPWAMAAELVETERTFARTLARIDPSWVEHLGAHLAKRSCSEPWWDPERGEAMVDERVTLYGLPIVAGRRISLARVDRGAARQLFVQRALVERDWPVELPPLERTRARIERIHALEERVRRHGLLAGDEALYDFYDAVLPEELTDGRSLERWWRRSSAAEPDLLAVPFSVLLDARAGPLDLAAYPDTWRQGDLELALRYRWRPAAEDDGVTVEVPLFALNRLAGEDPASSGFDWHVPGYRQELVTELIRSLPKSLRRCLVPAPDVASEVLERTGPADGPLLVVVAEALSRLAGVGVEPGDLDLDALPLHLRMAFEVSDASGRVLRRGRDLAALMAGLRGPLRAALDRAAPELVVHGATRWEFGDLPRRVERGMVLGYPSLVDEGESVGVSVLESASEQTKQMWLGTRRLLLLEAPVPPAHLQRRLTNETKLALARLGRSLEELSADSASAVADRIVAAHGGPPFEQTAFEQLAAEARAELVERVIRVTTIAGAVLAGAAAVEERAAHLAAGDRSGVLAAALADVRRQVAALVAPGFVTSAGTPRLRHLLRYLDAARRRLERLPADLRRDRERQARIESLQSRYEQAARALGAGAGTPRPRPGAAAGGSALEQARYLIEELRVSLWAQDLGTPVPVSEQRVARAIAEAMAG